MWVVFRNSYEIVDDSRNEKESGKSKKLKELELGVLEGLESKV